MQEREVLDHIHVKKREKEGGREERGAGVGSLEPFSCNEREGERVGGRGAGAGSWDHFHVTKGGREGGGVGVRGAGAGSLGPYPSR